MTLQCRICGRQFHTSHATQKTCSKECNDEAQQRREEKRIDRLLDRVPATQEPRRDAYESHCVQCGRKQRDYYLTPEQAHNHALVGFPPCTTCRPVPGVVTLDPVLLTSRVPGQVDARLAKAEGANL